ncbi:alpha/beta fold hydrolase [Bradyrhizobium sp. ARR65]|uniref:alpha/beta fold hydrolase n=1 Tax=Bradyrhizobium sp. ARR65 TaxID=1040989 RepID=UPI000A042BA4|nr:alpha/beta fold hydrolase [Bradyrhizobium sp. ARR65]
MLWPYTAAKFALDACSWWIEQGVGATEKRDDTELAWTTPNKVALDLATLRLRDFSRAQGSNPVLICAPYALHGALVADLAPSHSLVEALQRGGLNRLYATDWRSASSDMRYLSIDNYLADLNVAIDEIGWPVDLVGLCQGGWLSLVYAARFPEKVRRLVLVGSPVDMSVESDLSLMVANASLGAFEGLVNSGGGIVRGDDILRFWSPSADAEVVLQRSLSPDSAADKALQERFDRWHNQTVDLPGTYYLQVVNWIFRENRLAKGGFVALGREVHLDRLKVPIFLLAGTEDEVVPAAQALATASLLGTQAAFIERAIAPSTHLGLFMGARTLTTSWRRVAAWLQSGEAALRAREIA